MQRSFFKFLITMQTSHNFRIYFLFCLCFILSSCGSVQKSEFNDYRDGLLLTRSMISRFGEYSGDTTYLTYLKTRLLKKAPFSDKTNYKIVVLDTDQALAFSPGGGFILLSRGMIKRCKTESELAFIIAHEISHQYLGHTLILHESLDSKDINSYSKDQELAADKLAIALVATAGYNPNTALLAIVNAYYNNPYIHNSYSHPDMEERISAIRSAIDSAKWLPPGTINRRAFLIFINKLP